MLARLRFIRCLKYSKYFEYKRLIEAGLSLRQLGEMWCISGEGARLRLKKFGLVTNGKTLINNFHASQSNVVELYELGLSISDIARIYRVLWNTVEIVLAEADVLMNSSERTIFIQVTRTEKYCPKCTTTKDIEKFAFYSADNRLMRNSYCKECKAKIIREKRQKIKGAPLNKSGLRKYHYDD